MTKLKLKKLVIWPVTTLTGLATLFAIAPYNSEQKITNWYENVANDKLEVRGQSIISAQNYNGLEEEIAIDNNFELKLLLNPGFQSANEYFIKQFNNSFKEKITNTGLVFKSIKTSSIMPIIWLYFNNEQDRKELVAKIKNWPEIFKFILYKNEIKPNLYWTNNQSDYYSRAYPYNNQAPSKNLREFHDSAQKNLWIVKGGSDIYVPNKPTIKVGVLEVWKGSFNEKYKEFFDKGININELNSSGVGEDAYKYRNHSTNVSMILGSRFGIDKNAHVHLSTFSNDNEWYRAINKMINNGIRVINHSYGPSIGKKKDGANYMGYTENAYFLDYISRKYGVINVMSAGNDAKHSKHLISNKTLAFNSVVVGALRDFASSYTRKTNVIAEYSNYKLEDSYSNLAKPLVVAPAKFYNIFYDSKYDDPKLMYMNGTSYAAPVVTGLISSLLALKPNINDSEFKTPLIKAILSASAVSPQLDDLIYKSSGYEQKYGAGTVDFSEMLNAANNSSTIKIHPTRETGFIFTSQELNLERNQTIKISSSWTFNAGQLKNNELSPGYWNYAFPSIKAFNPTYEQAEWNKSHINETRLKKDETIKRQGGNLFTDYDLYLEHLDANGSWVTTTKISAAQTNDELIEFKVKSPGKYRYRIKKYNKNTFNNSVEDLIAVTHVIKN